jgi:hypothetical protein
LQKLGILTAVFGAPHNILVYACYPADDDPAGEFEPHWGVRYNTLENTPTIYFTSVAYAARYIKVLIETHSPIGE